MELVDAGFGAGVHDDTSGVTTLLARLTALRAGNLDNLDALISSRSILTAQQAEDEILDALTSAHVNVGSIGLTIRQIRDAAIAGSTLNSLMDRLRGATTGQLFASAGIAVTDQSQRVSTAENITTTETPPASSLSLYSVVLESAPTTMATFEVSANSGTNFATMNPAADAGQALSGNQVTNAGFKTMASFGIGATGRFRWTTPATAGTYIVHIQGASIS